MHETETKVLEVSSEEISAKLNKLGAVQIQDTKLVVDWFRPMGTKDGEDKWYLRIRSYADGKSEVTWKGKSEVLGASRTHKEINFLTQNPKELGDLFGQIGLETYAHQEKFRKSWELKEWRFDLDQYPNIPAYLEIEGSSEAHIQEALKLLGLEKNETSSEGERLLIEQKYGLDWKDMKF